MTAISESMPDEDYLISKVTNNLETDKAAAKSWMIFANSVLPQSFRILFQCYKIECEEKNLTESATCLCNLIKKFPSEITLIKELRAITDVLCSDSNDFLKRMFEELPGEVKYNIMLAVTRSAQSIEEHCELLLLFFKKMPSSKFLQHGSNIVDTLLKAEDRPGIHIPVNLFRKMLVCDALPLILRVSQHDYKFKIIFKLLQKAIEFYVCCMFTPPTEYDIAVRKEVSALSDSKPGECWKPLLKLFEAVALRFRWNYPEMFVSNFSELSLQQLLSLLKKNHKLLSSMVSKTNKQEEMSGFEEAYFCLVIIFFYYLHHFGHLVHPKMFSSMVTGSYNYVIMEGVSFEPDDCPKSMPNDFKQTDRGYIVISKCGTQEAANVLATSFITAVECWELLHRHPYLVKEFNSMCSVLKLETWHAFQEFYLSSLIYSKLHKQAIDHLGRIQSNAIELAHKNKAALQIASCFYHLRGYAHSLKILFDVIVNFSPVPATNSAKYSASIISKCPARYVYFMGYNNSEILQYCTSMLLKLYKCKEKFDDVYKDMALGYMLVLIQYNLENEYPLLKRCIEMIKNAKSFCFPNFFNYIINVVILEEISYLATPSGGNITLEILSTPTFQASKQRTVTRGANKGARDDLKQAFSTQVARCYDNLDNLFIEFFKQECNFLLLPLGVM